MILIKKTGRQKFYHTEYCSATKQYGKEHYQEGTEVDIEKRDLALCGHCKGTDRSSKTMSHYNALVEAAQNE